MAQPSIPKIAANYYRQISQTLVTTNDADLVIVWVFTFAILALIAAPFLQNSIVRSVLGFFFLLLVPGYTLVAALFPTTSELSTAERGALSFGMSIAIGALLGILLNYSPFGLFLEPLVVCLVFISAACSVVALRRRNAAAPEARFGFHFVPVTALWTSTFPTSSTRFEKLLNALLIISIVASLSGLVYVAAAPKTGQTFTEFYLLGPNGKAEDYPTQFRLGDQKPVTIGIINQENREMTYDVLVRLNATGQEHALYSETVTVAANQKWEKTIMLKPDAEGENMKLEFLLYANSNPVTPYRDAYLWIDVTT